VLRSTLSNIGLPAVFNVFHCFVGRTTNLYLWGIYKNGGWPVAKQRAFRIRFGVGRREADLDKKTIYRWVLSFIQTGSALKQTSPGRPRTATGPEIVAVVRASIPKSPLRSARKHAAAIQWSDRNVRRILHRYLRMHHYKIAIAPKLKRRDFKNRTKFCRDLLNVRVTDFVFFFLTRHISTSLAQ